MPVMGASFLSSPVTTNVLRPAERLTVPLQVVREFRANELGTTDEPFFAIEMFFTSTGALPENGNVEAVVVAE